MYESITIEGTFFTMKGFYFFFKPLRVPYHKLYYEAKKAGYKLKNLDKDGFIPIVEKSKSFGFGWIGVEVENSEKAANDSRIIKLSGEYKSYEHEGPYNQLGRVYKEIMEDEPAAKEYYSIYLNNPATTEEENLKTLICFR